LVPCRRVHGRRRRRVTGGDRGDERLLGRGRTAGAGQGPLGRRERPRQRRRQVSGVEGVPRLVVVRADRVGHPPVGHGAAGVGLDGPLEAADRLLVVERVRPDEPPVEPQLRVRRRGRPRPVVPSKVEVAGHPPASSPRIAGSFRRGNATRWPGARPDTPPAQTSGACLLTGSQLPATLGEPRVLRICCHSVPVRDLPGARLRGPDQVTAGRGYHVARATTREIGRLESTYSSDLGQLTWAWVLKADGRVMYRLSRINGRP